MRVHRATMATSPDTCTTSSSALSRVRACLRSSMIKVAPIPTVQAEVANKGKDIDRGCYWVPKLGRRPFIRVSVCPRTPSAPALQGLVEPGPQKAVVQRLAKIIS